MLRCHQYILEFDDVDFLSILVSMRFIEDESARILCMLLGFRVLIMVCSVWLYLGELVVLTSTSISGVSDAFNFNRGASRLLGVIDTNNWAFPFYLY